MAREQRVLFLGSSTIDFTETTTAESLFSLTLAELQRRAPDITWRCDKESLFFAANMAQRAAAARERLQPDIVFFCPPAFTFLHDSVANSLSARPKLRRAVHGLAMRLKALAGGGYEGASSARGLIFRVPRALAQRLLPPKPLIERGQALDYTIKALEALAEGDGPAVVHHLAVGTAPTIDATARRYREVLDRYNQALVRYCDEHGIIHYDLEALLRESGGRLEVMPDFLHLKVASRRFEAQALAGLLIEASKRKSRRTTASAP